MVEAEHGAATSKRHAERSRKRPRDDPIGRAIGRAGRSPIVADRAPDFAVPRTAIPTPRGKFGFRAGSR
jgi:hypothetical protein